MADFDIVRADSLAMIPHGFLDRVDHASDGNPLGFNVGLGQGGDDIEARIHRQRAGQAILAGAPLAAVTQVHSADVVTVRATSDFAAMPQADALVTDQPGLLLGIVTADCAPVLLADMEAGVIGAAHAGWRGAHDGVIENTVAAMEDLGAQRGRIAASIGPCIAQASYEVDAVFREQFTERDECFFVAGAPNHFQFDLESYVAARLVTAGAGAVSKLGLDTYQLKDRYFSYRRSTHLGTATYGRQMSLIGLPE